MSDVKQDSKKLNFLESIMKSQDNIHTGYRVGLIASAFYAYFLLNDKTVFRFIASAVKKMFTTPTLNGVDLTNSGTALFCSIPRNDYLEIMDFVRNEFSTNGVVLERTHIISLQSRMSTLSEILGCLRPALRLANSHKGALHERLFFFASYFYLLKGFRVLERSGLQTPKSAVFFNSSSFPESMLCEFFRVKGTKTFSMQHGMYLRPQLLSYDIVNITNVMADILLCWGEASKNEVEMFYQENNLKMDFRCEVAGYPRSLNAVQVKKQYVDKILVLLPRMLFKEESMNLLKLLQPFRASEEFIIKPHPSLLNDLEFEFQYKELGGGVDTRKLSECLGCNDFRAIIGFNTTSVFEAIRNSSRVFLYCSGRDEFSLDLFKYFSTARELEDLLNEKPSEALAYEMFFGRASGDYFKLIFKEYSGLRA